MEKVKILFVCHGNICRSTMAEQIMKDVIKKERAEARFVIDSAATSREEIGEPIYWAAEKQLKLHGIDPGTHKARQMTRKDYEDFDLLIGMDSANTRNMTFICGGDPENKIHLLREYSDGAGDISDPWYTRDFETAFRQIKAGCEGVWKHILLFF